MPPFPNHNVVLGVPLTGNGLHSFKSFNEVIPFFEERNYTISGVTCDSTGVALGSCVVRLFNAATNVQEQITTSDASGNYSFIVDKTQLWYATAYKAGAPDVEGGTVNTLAGA